MTNDVFVTYRHLRRNPALSTEGGVTLAILVDLHDPEDRHIKFGYALCNPIDNFDKRIGREVAYTHLRCARKWDLAEAIEYQDGPTLVRQVLDYITEHPSKYYKELNHYLTRHVY